ncbi:uncharacterized protein LOC120418145 [Culex pipiens pallens]|uniref:uncharacterized protein LOC120418145 n=1 Tax=Culex pipiens pallens TaxID=42434 RepID=UPI0019539056|nr:uncharacterized protein LOC120418145 [Culex pipiens pallens]
MQVTVYLAVLLGIMQISSAANLTNPGTHQNQKYKIHVTKLVCLEQPYKLTTLHACKVRLRRNQPTLITIEMDVPVLLNKVFLEFKMNYKLATYQPMMMQFTTEVCNYYRLPKGTEPVVDYINAGLKVYVPEIVHPCPYGKRYYNLSNWILDERYVPVSMPAGDYRLDARVSNKDNVTLINFQLFATIRSKGITPISLLDW